MLEVFQDIENTLAESGISVDWSDPGSDDIMDSIEEIIDAFCKLSKEDQEQMAKEIKKAVIDEFGC